MTPEQLYLKGLQNYNCPQESMNFGQVRMHCVSREISKFPSIYQKLSNNWVR